MKHRNLIHRLFTGERDRPQVEDILSDVLCDLNCTEKEVSIYKGVNGTVPEIQLESHPLFKN